MVIRPRLAASIALAILAACRTPAPPAAIDPALSARVPAATVAPTGVDLLTIARGVVPGATQIAPDLALSGAPHLISAATSAHPPVGILAPAESVAAGSPIWIAVRGGVALPLQGNLANANNLLRGTEYVTLAVQPGDPTQFELVARCPTPEAALRFEQSFRSMVSLVAATNARQAATAGMLQPIQ